MTTPYIGQIIMTGFGFTPRDFAPCNGQFLSIQKYPELFDVIGTRYGGDGVHDFAVPNLQGATPVGAGPSADPAWTPAPYALNDSGGAEVVMLQPGLTHVAQAAASNDALIASGSNAGRPNMQPFRVLNFCIALRGISPTPMIGEIRMLAFSRAPQGWLPCDGGIYRIADHDELFMAIGATYGGDGASTFGVPDLRGQVPVHQGLGRSTGARRRLVGEGGGKETVALEVSHLPAAMPALGRTLAAVHDNMMPTLTASYCIATHGAFPTRSLC